MYKIHQVLLMTFGLIANQICAFNYASHMVIAHIARLHIQGEEEYVLEQVNALLTPITSYCEEPLDGVGTTYCSPAKQSNKCGTYSYESYYFLEDSAIFADVIKHTNGQFETNWHFKDEIYNATSDSPLPSEVLFKELIDVESAIPELVSILRTNSNTVCAVKDSIEKAYGRECLEEVALKLLIHYVGDISQPLHNINRVTAKFPSGDKGGNLFNLTYHYGVNELHALWDSAIYEITQNVSAPLTHDTYRYIHTRAANIQSKYNITTRDVECVGDLVECVNDWHEDSFIIAKSAYNGIIENELPSKAYITEFGDIQEKEIAVAGARLAYLLTFIFKKQHHGFLQQ